MINKLLEELNDLWNSSEDPRFKGEHPGCDRIQKQIAKEFQNMEDNDVIEILDNIPQERMEQIRFVLECMEDGRPFINAYL